MVLALPSEEDSTKGQLENWAVGILDEGKLYLFDPRLGLPIPAPGGVKFDEDGQLDIQPATLEQVTKDPSLAAPTGPRRLASLPGHRRAAEQGRGPGRSIAGLPRRAG